MNKVILIVLASSLFITADAFSAYWGKTNNLLALLFAFAIGSTGYLAFGLLNKKLSLAQSGGLVNIALVVGALSVSLLFFGEHLSLKQIAGLILAMIAIYLMS